MLVSLRILPLVPEETSLGVWAKPHDRGGLQGWGMRCHGGARAEVHMDFRMGWLMDLFRHVSGG